MHVHQAFGEALMVLAARQLRDHCRGGRGGPRDLRQHRKFLRYLLSSNFGEVLTMFFGVLLADRIGLEAESGAVVLPLLATQILWINLVTDGRVREIGKLLGQQRR